MSFDRPGLEDDKTATDTEVNEALENDAVDESGLHLDEIEHDDGQRSPGPEKNEERRPPRSQDVTDGTESDPVEPPD
ncbi:hypothetical protein [Kribbella sp. NPDC006257]|uniref:hypothetical protein n=1 Tax=Kribbella sp. NPDC006257 TaxID=3156738 RepID=UPI0033A72ED2